MLLKKEQRKRAARSNKHAEVGFGTFDVSLELQIRVTHVILRTVVITENVLGHNRHVHSQPSPLLAQAKRKRYRKQQQQASADKQTGFLNLMDSVTAKNKPAPAPDNRPHRGDNKHLDPRKVIQQHVSITHYHNQQQLLTSSLQLVARQCRVILNSHRYPCVRLSAHPTSGRDVDQY